MKILVILILLPLLTTGCYTQLATSGDKWGYSGEYSEERPAQTVRNTPTQDTESVPEQNIQRNEPAEREAEPTLTEKSTLSGGTTIINNYYYDIDWYWERPWYWYRPHRFWWHRRAVTVVIYPYWYDRYYYPFYWNDPFYRPPYASCYYPYWHYPRYDYWYGYYGYYGDRRWGWGYPPVPINYHDHRYYDRDRTTPAGRPIRIGRIPSEDRPATPTPTQTRSSQTPIGSGAKLPVDRAPTDVSKQARTSSPAERTLPPAERVTVPDNVRSSQPSDGKVSTPERVTTPKETRSTQPSERIRVDTKPVEQDKTRTSEPPQQRREPARVSAPAERSSERSSQPTYTAPPSQPSSSGSSSSRGESGRSSSGSSGRSDNK